MVLIPASLNGYMENIKLMYIIKYYSIHYHLG